MVGKVNLKMWRCGEIMSIHKEGVVMHIDIHRVIHRLYQAFMRISTTSTITTIY